MRKTVNCFCTLNIKQSYDVNGLSEELLLKTQIPLLPVKWFYSLHTMRQTRALLLHHIMCQDVLLGEQEELLHKMYGQLQRTTNHYVNTLNNIYNNDQMKGETDEG